MKVTPLGDSALLLELETTSGESPEQMLRKVLSTKIAIERAKIPGVIECSSAYATVAVFFNPAAATAGGAEPTQVANWFETRVREAAVSAGKSTERFHFRKFEIPFCSDPEFGPDLGLVAAQARLTGEEVIRLYCAASFQVSCVGFTPGFPYLSGLPKELATPRQAEPRGRIPEGSVAIGGNQAGIYPMVSPGGWNLIGRTPLKLFVPQNDPPTLLQAGDHVRFKRISREEFDALLQGERTGGTAWK